MWYVIHDVLCMMVDGWYGIHDVQYNMYIVVICINIYIYIYIYMAGTCTGYTTNDV